MIINMLLGTSATVFGVLSIKSYYELDKDFNQQYKSKLFKATAERKLIELINKYDDISIKFSNSLNKSLDDMKDTAHDLEYICDKILDGEKMGYDMDIVPTSLVTGFIKAAKIVKKELDKELPSLLGKFIHK